MKLHTLFPGKLTIRPNARRGEGRRAFTLLEILAVMTIIAIVTSLAVPTLSSVLMGSSLNRAGRMMGDTLMLARQEAVTKNREVQVRFYHFTTGATQGWRGFQVLRVEQKPNGTELTPVTPVCTMPSGISIVGDSDLSPLLQADSDLTGRTTLPIYGGVDYAGFRIRPGGSLGGEVSNASNFLTLQYAAVATTGGLAANYYTVQMNPVTGKVSTFRP